MTPDRARLEAIKQTLKVTGGVLFTNTEVSWLVEGLEEALGLLELGGDSVNRRIIISDFLSRFQEPK